MDETIYEILKVLFDFGLEVWFSIDNWSDQNQKDLLQVFTLLHLERL